MRIVFATRNAHKVEEITAALPGGITLLSLNDIGLSGDVPETGSTLTDNALQKALYVHERCGLPVFSDDSGLEVDCLHGAPGVDTAHYSGSRDAVANMTKLLRAMEACTERTARFRTVIAFTDGTTTRCFEGEVRGTIATQMLGREGFGYDPVFIPQGQELTFAQMGPVGKAAMNHRVRALAKFTAWLAEQGM
jgi:XTP/dITP diphosphohydrolase